jgi:hypothetical protein
VAGAHRPSLRRDAGRRLAGDAAPGGPGRTRRRLGRGPAGRAAARRRMPAVDGQPPAGSPPRGLGGPPSVDRRASQGRRLSTGADGGGGCGVRRRGRGRLAPGARARRPGVGPGGHGMGGRP